VSTPYCYDCGQRYMQGLLTPYVHRDCAGPETDLAVKSEPTYHDDDFCYSHVIERAGGATGRRDPNCGE